MISASWARALSQDWTNRIAQQTLSFTGNPKMDQMIIQACSRGERSMIFFMGTDFDYSDLFCAKERYQELCYRAVLDSCSDTLSHDDCYLCVSW
jgi:hypothetical protein